MTTITALPTPPTRQDPDNFADRADTFLAALPTFVTETNALGSELNAASIAAVNAEIDATNSAAAAVAAANFKGSWSFLSGSLSIPSSVYHNESVWLLLTNLSNVATSEPSVTNTDWLEISSNNAVGSVAFFAGNTAPLGWLKANGAAVSRTAYSKLFAYIGTSFGSGDGSTTFNLPDLRGEFLRAWDDGRGIDSGRSFASTQSSQNLSHSHTGAVLPGGAHSHTTSASYRTSGGSVAFGGTGGSMGLQNGVNGVGDHVHGLSIDNSGGTEARPRNVALLLCIKY